MLPSCSVSDIGMVAAAAAVLRVHQFINRSVRRGKERREAVASNLPLAIGLAQQEQLLVAFRDHGAIGDDRDQPVELVRRNAHSGDSRCSSATWKLMLSRIAWNTPAYASCTAWMPTAEGLFGAINTASS